MTTQGWLPVVVDRLREHPQVVRAVLAEVHGSAPRAAGTSMVITPDGVHGTIGGGRLEWEVLASARAVLACGSEPKSAVCLRRLVLGTELGQCCGGTATVWLERYVRRDAQWLLQASQRMEHEPLELCSTWSGGQSVQHQMERGEPQRWQTGSRARLHAAAQGVVTLVELLERPVSFYLYGAGYVGRAVLNIAAELPWQITCIDSRAEWLATAGQHNVTMLCTSEPVATVSQAPVGSCFLVMTHSHALDYALIRAVLARDAAWVGLIGSRSKSARFRAQLRRDGVAASDVARLVCPIGIGILDKHPTAIAVGVIAQLLQHFQHVPVDASTTAAAEQPCARSCSECAAGSVLS